MTASFLTRMAGRVGRVVAVIVYFFCPGCDSPPRYQGVGSDDDHRTSPGPPPAHSRDTEP